MSVREVARISLVAAGGCIAVGITYVIVSLVEMPDWAEWLVLGLVVVLVLLAGAVWLALQRMTIDEAEGSLEPPAGL